VSGNGSATVNFGAWPGQAEATVDVSGQIGYVASSRVEAWILPIATTDHSIDEHVGEEIMAHAYYKVDGTFTIVVKAKPHPQIRLVTKQSQYREATSEALYGLWTVGWAWMD
jgi:hypothetical protein